MIKMTLQPKGCCRQLRFVFLCQLLFFVANTVATLESAAETGNFLKQQSLTHAFETAINNNNNKNRDENIADNEIEFPPSVEEQYVDVAADMAQLEAKQKEREQQQFALDAAYPDAATARLFTKLHNEQEHQQQQHHKQKPTATATGDIFNHQHKQQQPQQHHRYCNIEITTKVPGTCQSMRPIGSACVSGEYMDLFNMDCM